MAAILHQLIGKFTVSTCIPLLTGIFHGFDTSLYKFQSSTLCSMQYRWHWVFWEGCGCDDWRRWSNLRSSPLVVQPTAAFDLFVPWLRKWRNHQWNSTQISKTEKPKKPKHHFWKKRKSTSLSLSSRTSDLFGDFLENAWDLKWEITLWSWSTYTPLQNHHLSSRFAATFQLVCLKGKTKSTSAAACRKCMRAATALLEPIKTWQFLFRTSHYLC